VGKPIATPAATWEKVNQLKNLSRERMVELCGEQMIDLVSPAGSD